MIESSEHLPALIFSFFKWEYYVQSAANGAPGVNSDV